VCIERERGGDNFSLFSIRSLKVIIITSRDSGYIILLRVLVNLKSIIAYILQRILLPSDFPEDYLN